MAFLRVHFRTFVHATESETKVKEALAFVAPDAEIIETRTEGHFGNPLIILEATITRNREIKAFFERLSGSGMIEEMLSRLDERMDDNCNLHIRLSKEQAYKGQLQIASDKNVIDCSFKTGAYPASKENACKAAASYLEDMMGSGN